MKCCKGAEPYTRTAPTHLCASPENFSWALYVV